MGTQYNILFNGFSEGLLVSPDLLPATKYSLAHDPKYYLFNEATRFEDEIGKLMLRRSYIKHGNTQTSPSQNKNKFKLAEAMNSMSLGAKTSKQSTKKSVNNKLRSSSFWNDQLTVTVKNEPDDQLWTELWLEQHWPSKITVKEPTRPRPNLQRATRAIPKPQNAAQNSTLRFPFTRKTTGRY